MEVQVISDTVQKFNGESYYFCGTYFQRKGKRLHRAVWEYHNGEIPEGYHVHHVDENRKNNDISNLALIDGKKHCSLHGTEKADISRNNVKIARQASREWHGSENGRSWHSEHAKKNWKKAPIRSYVCDFCGKEFYTKHAYGELQHHFCGNNCKAKFRTRRLRHESEKSDASR